MEDFLNNFTSLLLYSLVFLSSMFFLWMYQKKYGAGNLIGVKFSAKDRLKKFSILTLSLFFPVLISSVRYGLGTDFFNYQRHYLMWSDLSFVEVFRRSSEPLAFILHPLAKMFFNDVWGYFLLSSLIIMVFITKAISYFKDRISMPFSLFIYFMIYWSFSLNGIRQMMAMAIVVFAFRYILERKPLKYVALIILAANFHTSAIICVFFYFLNGLSKTKRFIYHLLLTASPIIMATALQVALNLDMFSKYAERYNINLDAGGLGFLIWIIPAIVPILYYREKLESQYDFLVNIALLQIPFQYIGYYVSFGGRIAYYALITQIILIPLIINSIESKREKSVVMLYFIIWFLVYYLVQSFLWNYSETFPYQSILAF